MAPQRAEAARRPHLARHHQRPREGVDHGTPRRAVGGRYPARWCAAHKVARRLRQRHQQPAHPGNASTTTPSTTTTVSRLLVRPTPPQPAGREPPATPSPGAAPTALPSAPQGAVVLAVLQEARHYTERTARGYQLLAARGVQVLLFAHGWARVAEPQPGLHLYCRPESRPRSPRASHGQQSPAGRHSARPPPARTPARRRSRSLQGESLPDEDSQVISPSAGVTPFPSRPAACWCRCEPTWCTTRDVVVRDGAEHATVVAAAFEAQRLTL